MNPYLRITVKCCVCGKEETDLYKVLIREGWRINGTRTKCRDCARVIKTNEATETETM